MRETARSSQYQLASSWDSKASATVRYMVISLGYLPLDDKIIQECFIGLLETEIAILEKIDPNWRKFQNYVIKTYVDYKGILSPAGKI